MRIRFASTEQPSVIAKTLKKLLSAEDVDVKLSAAQNVVGNMFGYRNWHELAVATKIPAPATPLDEQVDPSERTARRERYVFSLVEAIGISRLKAETIVDALRPTAARRVGRKLNYAHEAIKRLEDLRKLDGFVAFDPSTWEAPHGVPAYSTTYKGARVTAWIVQSTPRKDGYVPARVEVVARQGNMIVGVLRGASVSKPLEETVEQTLAVQERTTKHPFPQIHKPNRPVEIAMSAAFKSEYPDLPDPYSVLDRQDIYSMSGGRELLDMNGILMVTEWESAKGIAPKRIGIALLKAAMKAYDRSMLGRSSIVIDPVPVQYADLPRGVRETRADFVEATIKIAEHFISIVDEPRVRVASFYGVLAPRLNDGAVDTVTLPSEPTPIVDWPHDHDPSYAAYPDTPIEFAPHPMFWVSMPSDLVGMHLNQAGAFECDEAMHYNFIFENGTQLTLHRFDLEMHAEDGRFPRVLSNKSGKPLRTNPFTGKMSVQDMMSVLTRNIHLAYPNGPITKAHKDRCYEISRP